MAYASWLGIVVSLHTTNPRDQISPYETLTLSFSQAVRPKDVENQLQLQPSIPGKLEWQDDHTAHFIPARPYLGKVTIHLVPGKIGANGEWLRVDASWTLTVRPASIVYMNYVKPQDELMVILVNGGAPRQLTSTGGKVYDFDVSPSGDTVAYSLFNDQGGIDVWLVDRNGQNPRRLLDCGASHCSSVAWSPDGKSIAYNRESAGLTPNSATGAPRPWIVNAETGETRAVYSDPQTIGFGALWSPDGNWLASYDGVAAQIHVINLNSGQQVLLPSFTGFMGSWSPNSQFLVYPNQTTGVDNILKTYLYRADFKTGEVSTFLGKDDDTTDYMYGNPAWSPKGDQIAVSLRPNSASPDQQLWVINPDTLGGPMIAQEPGYTYDSYQWDPSGAGLLVQQVGLKKKYLPEIAVWYPLQGYKVIAENGTFPRWLP
jgi:Tol biopolymer transport system component